MSYSQENSQQNQPKLIAELNDENFAQNLANQHVVIDFWAPWCGPCKMFNPTFQEAAEYYAKNNIAVKFCKVNIDENPNIAQKYSIRSIPTLLFIKNQQILHTRTGFCDVATLKTEINTHFGV